MPPTIRMHFVGYHNTEKMDDESDGADDNYEPSRFSHSFVTRKSPDHMLGGIIWWVSGVGQPRLYTLNGWFEVVHTEPIDDDRFTFRVEGDGPTFPTPVPLNRYAWFADFRHTQGNFGLGINRIQPQHLGGLVAAVRERAYELPDEFTGSTSLTSPTPSPPPLACDLAEPPPRVQATVNRIVRNTPLAQRVKELHRFECQVCGSTIELPGGGRYAESHHLKPLGTPHDGPDVPGNVLCLCPNHHAACDLGAVRLDLATLRVAGGHDVEPAFVAYHNTHVFKGP